MDNTSIINFATHSYFCTLLSVLEELTFGIPQHAWRLVLVVLITAFLTIKYLVPRFLSSLHEHANLKTHEKRNS